MPLAFPDRIDSQMRCNDLQRSAKVGCKRFMETAGSDVERSIDVKQVSPNTWKRLSLSSRLALHEKNTKWHEAFASESYRCFT
jgi:hypothetical protein